MNYADKQFLCLHAIETLPDSLRARRRILNGIVETLKDCDIVGIAARQMLLHLDQIERAQGQLRLDIEASAQNDGHQDGDGHHKIGDGK